MNISWDVHFVTNTNLRLGTACFDPSGSHFSRNFGQWHSIDELKDHYTFRDQSRDRQGHGHWWCVGLIGGRVRNSGGNFLSCLRLMQEIKLVYEGFLQLAERSSRRICIALRLGTEEQHY